MTENKMTENKILYKAFFPNLYMNEIFEINMVSENRFVITTSYASNPNHKFKILKILTEIGFCTINEIKFVKTVISSINTWKCIKYTVVFDNFNYKQFEN